MKPILFFTLILSLFSSPLYAKSDVTLDRKSSESKSQLVSNPGSLVVREKGIAAPPGTPSRAIQDLEDKMDSYKTGAILTAEDKAYNAKVKREVVTGTFDIRELCRLSLDKHWATLTAAEQNRFVDLMTRLLEKRGILSKEQSRTRGKRYYIKYLSDTFLDPQKTRARTRTLIHVPKEEVNISIDYKLVKNGNEWKVFDVIVDDASLVDNYRYQFDSIIKKHGYPELVSRIEKKVNEASSN